MYIDYQTEPRPSASLVLKKTGSFQRVKFWANFFSTTTDLTFVYLGTNPAIEESCDYYDASCDQQLDYCILTCSGPTLPFTILVRFDNESDKFEPVQNLENNDIQREAIAELQLPTVQNFVVPEDNGEDACDDIGSSYEICLLSLFILPSLPPSLPLSLPLSFSRGSLPQW